MLIYTFSRSLIGRLGTGERGQTGIRPDGHALKPRDIWTPTKLVIPKHAIRQISLGSEHCLAVTVDDAVTDRLHSKSAQSSKRPSGKMPYQI